jgi:G patch domain-containing protein 1
MTRSVIDFYPTRLVCKRFNVKPPAHVQPDDYPAAGPGRASYDSPSQFGVYQEPGPARQEPLQPEFGLLSVSGSAPGEKEQLGMQPPAPEKTVVDSSRNEALEGKRAGEDVFKAIFGDSDDED